jgi:hypothetical protein
MSPTNSIEYARPDLSLSCPLADTPILCCCEVKETI